MRQSIQHTFSWKMFDRSVLYSKFDQFSLSGSTHLFHILYSWSGYEFYINEGTYPSFLWALAIRNLHFLIAKGHYFIIKRINVDDSILSWRFASSRILWQAYDWEKSNVPGTCCWFIPNPNVPSPASVGRRSCISSSSSTPKYVSRILMHFS